MNKLVVVPFLIFIFNIQAQDMNVPYEEIPEAPSDYTSGNVIGRMIDGLGYRYHWATKNLTPSDLSYSASENGRTILETLQHIYGMSETILESPKGEQSIRPKDFGHYSYEELRRKTLENLLAASKIVKGKTADDISSFRVIFKRAHNETAFPYWNMLNGMLSDCIHHTGQITTLRRANGNPQNPNVNVFLGKTRG